MKPIKLALTAFGSYAEKQIVDFDKFNSGLYMITGKTGAGKTTIFDAIVFALYGDTSGGRRSPKEMHCDLCPKETESQVDFTFEHEGKIHRIVRTLKYKKKDESYEPKGVYYPPDNEAPIEKNIAKRMEELIGLKKEDFCQVVMLAQGEFRKFLDESDDERTKILKSIFNMRAPEKMQDYIERAYKIVQEKRSLDIRKRSFEMENFIMPENLGEEETLRYSAGNRELEKHLQELCENDRLRLEMFGERKADADKARITAGNNLQKAKSDNKTVEEYEKASRTYDDLISKKPAADAEEQFISSMEIAFNTVKPLADNAKDAAAELEKHRENIKENKTACEAANSDYKKAKAQKISAHIAHDENLKFLLIEAENINSSLPKYEEYETLQSSLKKSDEKLSELEAKRNNQETAIAKHSEELKRAKDRIVELGETGAALEKAKNALITANGNYNKIIGKNGIQEAVNCARAAANKAQELKENEAQLYDFAITLKGEYDRLYNMYMNAQASVLADKLRSDIREKGNGKCPVCGTLFYTLDNTEITENISAITEDEVKKASDASNVAFEEFNAASLKRINAETTSELLRKTAYEKAVELFGEIDGLEDKMVDGEFLSQKTEEYKYKLKQATQVEKDAKILDLEKNNLNQLTNELNANINDAQTSLKEINEKIGGIKEKSNKVRGQLAEAKKLLKYENRATAQKEMESFTRKHLAEKEIVDDADNAFSEAEKTLHGLKELESSLEKQLGEKEQSAKERTAAYKEAILKYGFANEEEYKSFLPTGGQNEITRRRNEVNDYLQKLAGAVSARETTQSAAKGLEKRDTEELTEILKKAEAEFEEADNKFTQFNTVATSHDKTYKNIRAINERLAASDRIFEILEKLNSVAQGGGKYKFERYVMGDTFRHVLASANERLFTLTDGRYSLEHKVEATRASAQHGLGIKVLDNFSQHDRGTGTVSGGESFQVSLALALGLSDVVRANSDSKKIDAVFIDEGFGSLDSDNIIKAYKVLSECAGKDCKVGVITHVDQLSGMGCDILEINHSEQKGSTVSYNIMSGI